MAPVSVKLSEQNFGLLQETYQSLKNLRPEEGDLPPFDQWLQQNIVLPVTGNSAHDDMRSFKAIENLVTSLQSCGYTLIRHAEPDASDPSGNRLAHSLAQQFNRPDFYLKRIQDVLDYYQKPADFVAATARHDALESVAANLRSAYRELLLRSDTALDHLSEDRAIGRAEGAVAMLVTGTAMTRHEALQQTAAFKKTVRGKKNKH
jgi:hypothetical protein